MILKEPRVNSYHLRKKILKRIDCEKERKRWMNFMREKEEVQSKVNLHQLRVT
jgi:hypothetical protein